ncbi:MAG: class I SAM-dependent methyltransferase, partial [Chloroflexales bacterium]|nr:class I SAM-dependent methyltransferase [Chloroflexales bacterium]
VALVAQVALDLELDVVAEAEPRLGAAAQLAAERGLTVAGLDASPKLIAIARERTPSGEFHLGDMERLPFADRSFDFITGFNAFQFAGNPGLALGEARRVAKPGALVLIMTPGAPEARQVAALLTALQPLLPPPPPPPGAPGPFALSDETALRAFATGAGLVPADIFDVGCRWTYPNLAVAQRGLRSSGMAARAVAHSSEAAVDAAQASALQPFRQADGSYAVPVTYRCLLAHA